MTNLILPQTATLQIGIRQRSLRRHCRLGRATELVFILATGAMLTLGTGAEAQAVWDGGVSTDFTDPANFDGATDPTNADVTVNDAGATFQPTLAGGDALTINSGEVSDGTLTIGGDLTTTTGLTVTGTGTVNVSAGGSLTGALLGGGGDATNDGTIDAVTSNFGNFTNNAAVTGQMQTNGGIVLLSGGSTVGSLSNISGTTDISGGVTGAADVSGGTATLNTGGDIGGAVTVSGTGTLTVNAADTVAGVTQSGGTIGGTGLLTTTTYEQTGGDMAGLVETTTSATLNGGTISGTLSGTDATVQTGTTTLTGTIDTNANVTGTLALDGGDVTGDIDLSGGTVQGLSDTTLTGVNFDFVGPTGTVTADAATTLTLDVDTIIRRDGATATFGTAGVDGTVVLGGAGKNTGAGTEANSSVVVAGGTLTMGTGFVAQGFLSSGAANSRTTIDSGATVDLNGFATDIGRLTGAGTITSGAAGAVDLTLTNLTGENSTFSGVIEDGAGKVAVTKGGAGTLTLSGTNTHTGGTEVADGTLILSGGSAIVDDGEVTVSSPGVLQVDTAEEVGSINGSGDIVLNATLTSGQLGMNTTASGDISGAGGMTLTGTALLTLSGTNTYDGLTTVQTGAVLEAASDGALGSTAAGTVVDAGGALQLNGGTPPAGLTVAEAITLNGTGEGGSGGALRNVDGNNDVNGLVTLATDARINSDAGQLTLLGGVTGTDTDLTVGGAAFVLIASDITTGAGGLTKDGAGALGLSGTNTFTGDVQVSGGNVQLSGGAALADTVQVTLDSGTILQVGTSETVGNITGAGDISLGGLGSDVTLTLGDATGTTLSGVISENADVGSLTKQGTGTVILSGANTYTGTTTVSDGTLEVTGSVAGNVTVDGAGRLRIGASSAIGGTITTTGSTVSYANGVNEGSALIISSATTDLEVLGTDSAQQSGVISSTGVFGFEKVGTGNLTVSGTNTYTGETVVSAGTLTISNSGALGATGVGAGTTVASGAALALSGTISTGEAISISGTGVSGGGALRNLSDTNGITGTVTLAADASIVAVDGQFNIGAITGTNRTLTVGGPDGNIHLTGVISTGTGGLIKDGANTVFVEGVNTFSGNTTINGGALDITNGSALSDSGLVTINSGSLIVRASETVGNITGGGNIFIAAGTLTVGDATASSTYGGQILNAGALTKAGSGELILSNTNTYAGATTVNAGTLNVTGSVASAVVNVNNAGVLRVDGASLADTAAVTLAGTANLDLTGNETIGSLASAVTTTTVTLGANTLTIGGDGDGTLNEVTTFAGVISGTGGLTKSGGDTQVLSGINTFTGDVTINGGTLAVSGGAAIDNTVEVAVGSGGTFRLDGDEDIGALSSAAADATVNVGGNDLGIVGGQDTTYAGLVTGTGTIANNGTGRLELTGNGSGFTGALGAIGTGSEVAITGTGTTNATGVGATSGNTFTTDGGALLALNTVVAADGQVTFTGSETVGTIVNASASGTATGTITLTGAGTILTVNGSANALNPGNFNGTSGTVDGAGTLNISGGSFLVAATGDVQVSTTIGAGGTVVNNGTMAAVSNAGSFTNNLTAGALTNTGAGAGSNAATGTLASLTHNSTGTFTNSGAVTGNVTVSAGTVTLSGSSNIGNGSTVTVSGGALNAGVADTIGALVADGGSTNVTADLTIGELSGTAGSIVVTDPAGLVLGDSDSTNSSFGGVISGTGYVQKVGTDLQTLTGINTYTGGTTASGGTLAITGTGELQTAFVTIDSTGAVSTDGGAFANTGGVLNSKALTITNNGVLALTAGGDESIASLNGSGITQLSSGSVLTLNSGVSNVTGTISGAGGLEVAGGTTTLTAANTYTGPTDVTGGSLIISGTGTVASTDIETSGTGLLSTDGGALLAGAVLTNGGTGVGGFTITGGSETIASITGAGLIRLETGSLTLTSGTSNVSGVVSGSGTFTVDGGDVTLSATNTNTGDTNVESGTLTLTGTIGADANVTGGEMVVNGGTVTGATENDGGTIDIASGTFTGGLTNLDGTVEAEGTITGNIRNEDVFTVTGDVVAGNAANTFINVGTTNVLLGSITGYASIGNDAGTMNVGSGRTIGATTITNESVAEMVLTSGTVAGAFTNRGLVTTSGTSAINGTFNNTGTVDMSNGATGDVLNISGATTSAAIYQMDLNLSTGETDRVNGNGGVSGTINLQFAVTGGGAAIAPITVMTGVAGGATFTQTGLPTGGGILYTVANNGGDLQVQSDVNPAIAGVAAGAALTQSLIGSVVNRPTSPFLSGLAEGEACSHGGYARFTGGMASADGTTRTASNVNDTSISSHFAGIQGGYDVGCYDGRFFNGWDGTLGVMLGYNAGSTEQGVFSDPIDRTLLTSSLSTDFSQNYIGLYVAGSKDRISADMQLRYEQTDFDLTENEVVAGYLVGLDNLSFSTNTTTVGSRFSYRMDVNEEKGINFVPTIGFNYSSTSGDMLTLAGNQTLTIDPFNTTVGFFGGTLAQTKIDPNGTSATTTFVSGNYYQDFGGSRGAVFDPDTLTAGDEVDIGIDSIGGFAEASIGMNYVKILDNGPAGAKQLNASVRADARFGGNVSDAYSLTAQVRLTF